MIHAPVPPESWAAEGARTAGALEEVAAALVIGADPAIAALVAIAIARAQRGDRRVAVADLVGDLGALGGSPPVGADGAPPPGLLDCIRDGLPVSEIARPLCEDGRIFILPSGGPGVGERLVLESARWPRLVAGFREVDALLLLVVAANAPGLPTLLGAVDGVIAVDLPPVLARTFPLLATVDRPEPELLPVRPLPDRPPRRARGRRWAWVLAALALIAAGGLGLLEWRARARAGAQPPADATGATGRGGPALGGTGTPAQGVRAVDSLAGITDTITLGSVVNPDDSTNATGFTVELVAANTLAGANSGLAMRGVDLPAPTLTPVLLGADGRPWYRALTGAWHARSEAESFLATLRERGLVRDDVGRVLRAPYALRLVEGMPSAQVTAAIAQWEARGISAYALLQDDGRASLFAGAFETPGQSVLVALSLRDIGVAPVLAFRTGRMF
ncbi:MAG: hypothetical protein K8S21_02175 [Gemmatimonadetes bacterium]|nr:hypothetical protein [Gemmatimonadota bacterium]